MNKGLKIILGIILVIIPLYLIVPGMPLSDWGAATWEVIKGGVTIFIILLGIVLIIMGIDELRG
ncbi:hypothetical protein J4411_00635 [Candidatus Pacearchaeota archaeon]|nr:hypothetical protein [uncultured archaeon]MBS3084403.1 hypothetical protein [Candidatus Pacearchaeota archaeon]